jgi:hypothetical protein
MTESLKNIARYDKGVVQGETSLTEEGYIKARAIVTRCGVFLYKNADGTVRKELRHPDDVLEKDSLESIKMIPVVNGHPPERLVSAENAKRLAVGYTGESVDKEMPYIVANLMITDQETVDLVKSKSKNQLSLGYTVDLIPEAGTYYGEPYDFRQTNIRYNHLALVDQARAGPEARISLDGEDAEEIEQEEAKVAKTKKVKIDNEEYMLEEGAANGVVEMMRKHEELEKQLAESKMMLDKVLAERDSLRDKDVHPPAMEHQEKDEIGPNGKEEMDPVDLYGMQSHVRDYTPPTKMENHAVTNPKNEHYPHDLPHISKVDAADVNLRVKQRVKLEKLAERFLDKKTLQRLDGLSDIEVKKCLIYALQPNARLDGKSEVYINARFDAACESVPGAQVMSAPSVVKGDSDPEKDAADATEARKAMIQRQKNCWKGGRK